MDKDGPDSETDMSLPRKIGAFAVQHLNYGHVRFGTSSMVRRSEATTVDVHAGLVSEQCLHDLGTALDDCDTQRHFPFLMHGVDICTSVEQKLD
jgi:hypothetical protein